MSTRRHRAQDGDASRPSSIGLISGFGQMTEPASSHRYRFRGRLPKVDCNLAEKAAMKILIVNLH
jgi:hypothetical protein